MESSLRKVTGYGNLNLLTNLLKQTSRSVLQKSNVVPKAIFGLPLIAKRCAGDEVDKKAVLRSFGKFTRKRVCLIIIVIIIISFIREKRNRFTES